MLPAGATGTALLPGDVFGQAGARYPQTFNGQAVTPLEGKSLRPILEGRERQPHEAIYWEHEGNRAVRQGR
jgi:arylsulfatase